MVKAIKGMGCCFPGTSSAHFARVFAISRLPPQGAKNPWPFQGPGIFYGISHCFSGFCRSAFQAQRQHGRGQGAGELRHQHRGQHGGLRADCKGHVGRQQAGAADHKGAYCHLAPVVHLLVHGQGGEGAHQANQHARQALGLHVQLLPQPGEGPHQQPPYQLRNGQASQQHHGNGGHRGHGVGNGRHAGDGVEACHGFHRRQRQADGHQPADALRQQDKALDHLVGDFPQPQQQQHRQGENGQILVEALHHRKPAEQPAGHQAHRHGHQPQHDALGEKGPVRLGNHPHAHGDGEHQRAPKDGGHHQPGVVAQLGVLGQLQCQLVAAHVNGEQAAEHGRVHADKAVQGHDHVAQPLGQHRGDANHPHHGQSHGTQQHKPRFEFVAKAPFVAPQAVKAAQHGAGGHDYHQHFVHRPSLLESHKVLAHGVLNGVDGPGRHGGEVLAAALGDQAVVLHPEADAPLLVVDADVHAEHHVGGDGLRRLHRVVDVKAHVVGAAVPHVLADVVHVVQHPGVLQKLGAVPVGFPVHILHGHAGLDDGEHVVGCLQGDVVQQGLPLVELAVAGPAPGDVGHHIVVPGAHVV